MKFARLGRNVSFLDKTEGTRLFDDWGGRKESPRTVIVDLGGELLHSSVLTHRSAVDSDDIANSLSDGEIFEFVCEEDESACFNEALFGDWLLRVCQLESADISIAVLDIVGIACVHYHRIEVYDITVLIRYLALRKTLVRGRKFR